MLKEEEKKANLKNMDLAIAFPARDPQLEFIHLLLFTK